MTMNEHKKLINHAKARLIIQRFALQIIENHKKTGQTALIGIQPRGVNIAKAIYQQLKEMGYGEILYGEIDNTFFRDDIGRGGFHLPKPSKIEFSTEGKNIILVDDVLYTGRTVRAAIDAIMSFGRPARIELMVLVDRIYQRELPIEPNFVGVSIDSKNTDEFVKVEWNELSFDGEVWLLDNKQ